MANRTFVRLGALTGACAAFGQAAAVFMAFISATVIPAETAGFVKPGRAAAVSDQRERLPQFRAEAREARPAEGLGAGGGVAFGGLVVVYIGGGNGFFDG